MPELREAIEKLKSHLPPLGTERVTLPSARGRVLAEDLFAEEDLPPYPRAAMDGYAVKFEDIAKASRQNPVILSVVDFVAAGSFSMRVLRNGEAVAIATGAPLPEGADTVIRVEDTRPVDTDSPTPFAPVGGKVAILVSVPKGKNVSPAGEDIRKGELIACKGQKITPALVGLLAACGFWEVEVFKKPKVAVLPTGNELVPVTEKPNFAQVRESTSWAIAASLEECGCQPTVLKPIPDEFAKLRATLQELIHEFDLIVTCGGVSVGQHDFVKPAWESLGGKVLFWHLPIRPGKNALAVVWNGKLAIGLSGNPAAALTTFDLIVRPALCEWTGSNEGNLAELKANLTEPVQQVKGFWKALRVKVEQGSDGIKARPLKAQLSTVLSSLVDADGYALIPPGEDEIAAESEVTVMVRNWSPKV